MLTASEWHTVLAGTPRAVAQVVKKEALLYLAGKEPLDKFSTIELVQALYPSHYALMQRYGMARRARLFYVLNHLATRELVEYAERRGHQWWWTNPAWRQYHAAV